MRDGRTMTKSTPQLMKSRVGTCADRPPCCGGCCCLLDYFWYDCGRSATFSPSTCSPARHAKRCRERLHPQNPLRRKSLVARQPHETVRFFFFARAACCTSLRAHAHVGARTKSSHNAVQASPHFRCRLGGCCMHRSRNRAKWRCQALYASLKGCQDREIDVPGVQRSVKIVTESPKSCPPEERGLHNCK